MTRIDISLGTLNKEIIKVVGTLTKNKVHTTITQDSSSKIVIAAIRTKVTTTEEETAMAETTTNTVSVNVTTNMKTGEVITVTASPTAAATITTGVNSLTEIDISKINREMKM